MNALVPLPQPDSIYVYAVLPGGGGAVPEAAAILAGSRVGSLEASGLAVLVSTVPRCLFEPNHPQSRAADPGWVAECAEAHHRIVALAAQAGPCLPLGFGTLFTSEASLRAWMASEAAALRKTLEAVADRHEWALALIEDPFAHEAWLEAHEPSLRSLAEAVRAASPGTGFLLERRLARAREAARAQHQEAAAARLADRLAAEAFAVRRETGQPGHAWSLLADRDAGLAGRLAAIGAELFDGTGLALRVTGPWPPYAFARAAWQESGDA
jgi:hypothetical protein